MSTTEEDKSLSILAVYDDLVRNGAILTDGSEPEFLTYVGNSEVSRQRWEHAELECQRLSIELTRCSQDISNLEHKLKHARLMLDNELHLRKKAEAERDKMANQLQMLKQLVMDTDSGIDEVTIDKIRGLDVCGVRPTYTNINFLSPGLTRETMNARVSTINLTEASVLDVDDLSFDIDDTANLCESRTRAGTFFRGEKDEVVTRRKRSRSTTKMPELPVVAENVSKKGRRSYSVGHDDVGDLKREEMPRQPRSRRSAVSEGRGKRSNIRANQRRSTMSNKSTEGKENTVKVDDGEAMTEHTLVEKTVIKSEKCVVCSKRIKFGKIYLKCLHCKETLHMECRDSAGTCHATSPKASGIPFPSLTTPNKRASTYLTPSKKDNKNTIFASPMLR